MKIYLLKRLDERCFWDQYYGFVIRAESELEAREIAFNECNIPYGPDDSANMFKDPSISSCEEISASGEKGILLADFNAG